MAVPLLWSMRDFQSVQLLDPKPGPDIYVQLSNQYVLHWRLGASDHACVHVTKCLSWHGLPAEFISCLIAA